MREFSKEDKGSATCSAHEHIGQQLMRCCLAADSIDNPRKTHSPPRQRLDIFLDKYTQSFCASLPCCLANAASLPACSSLSRAISASCAARSSAICCS